MRDRRKYPTGVYDRGAHWYAVAKVGRDLREDRRFSKDTAIRTIVYWQEEARSRLRKEAASNQPRAGTLGADIQRYLTTKVSMRTHSERERHLELWTEAFGRTRARSTIEPWEIRAVTERWHQAGLSGASCNRRLNALSNVWTVLDGRHERNPVKGVERYDEDGRPAPPLDYGLAEQIIDAMPDKGQGLRRQQRAEASKTKARLRVMLYTGLPQVRIMRIDPVTHIDWQQGGVWLAPRRKGKGRQGRWFPVSRRGMEALRELAAVEAFGVFSTSSMRQSFRRAARAFGRTDLTPYDLRHLYGRTMLRVTGDRDRVRDLMDHSDVDTTGIYMRQAIPDDLRDAQRRFDEYLDDVLARGVGASKSDLVNIAAKSKLVN